VLLSLIIRSADLLLLLLGQALIRFRQEGRIARQGDDELLRLDR